MTQAHPCLLRKGKASSKYRHFPFLEDQIKIGRADDVTYTILSTTISRCHAIFEKQKDSTWTIKDNKSLNGISVNGKRLKPHEPCTLQDGDTVQLGVPKDSDAPSEFIYTFFSSLKVRREPKSSRDKGPGTEDASPKKRPSKPVPLKNMLTECDENAGRSQKRKAPASEEDQLEHKRLKTAYESKLHALTEQLKEKEKEKIAIAQQLQQERQEKQVMKKKQKEQEANVSKLAAKQKQLIKEKSVAEAKMRQELEEQLKEREQQLRKQMQEKLALLTTEKKQVEERLKKEMEKAVREKNQELQDKLHEEKDRLQKVIETKELEQKALESQLAESRMEKEKAKADTLTTREAILSEFADTMETELQCTICSELFVKATSLNCSHAFCALCIRQWLAVKKECPNCRATVTSQMRSIVLDNYIDRMVEQLSAEMKQRRIELVAERKEAEAKLDEAENPERPGPSGTTTRGRGRGRGRAGRGRRGGAARGRRAASAPDVVATVTHDSMDTSSTDNEAGARSPQNTSGSDSEVITDSDEEESESSASSSDYSESSEDVNNAGQGQWANASDSDEDSVDEYGVERGYYGGYGRCFSCGREGHWANQCPG